MGQMQINHGRVDLLVTEQFLDGAQMGSGLQHMRGEGMAQRMDRSVGNVELLAGRDQESLQGRGRHGTRGVVHARGHRFGVTVATSHVGEDQQGMPVKGPVSAQLLVKAPGQGNHAILMAFALANAQLVVVALDVVNGQGQAFAQAQTATIDEFQGSAITSQANVGQQIVDLRAGENRRERVVILGANLGEDRPLGVAQEIDKEHASRGPGLADGFGLPVFLEFDEKEVVAQLGLGEEGRITGAMLVDQAHLAVIGVPGSIGVVAQGQQLGELGHGLVGMLVVDRVGVIAPAGAIGLVGWVRNVLGMKDWCFSYTAILVS
jgi:hypothetical protein